MTRMTDDHQPLDPISDESIQDDFAASASYDLGVKLFAPACAGPALTQPAHELRLAKLAKLLYDARIKRRKFLDGDLLAEPAWDILLDLYIAHVEGRSLRTSSVCVASNTPPTTALRWIGVLEGQGLIEREDSRDDQRARNVGLTPAGLQAIEGCLEQYSSTLEVFFAGGPPIASGRGAALGLALD